jgi:hypothetical protein
VPTQICPSCQWDVPMSYDFKGSVERPTAAQHLAKLVFDFAAAFAKRA